MKMYPTYFSYLDMDLVISQGSSTPLSLFTVCTDFWEEKKQGQIVYNNKYGSVLSIFH
jgi:hypothetical protein